ncbi:MAG: hypothetical protein V2I82_16165 [Halieaceae bacterium]|jgi:hypothetical protein|nr:hypothetical protein [Halieaceae bacterium]
MGASTESRARADSDLDPLKLRNLAAVLVTLSGAGQCFSLWLLPTTETLLATALLGSLYLLLALGLFGIGRLAPLLAVSILPLRSWFGVAPLDIPAWEFLRIAGDATAALLCLPVLWASLDHRHREIEPADRRRKRRRRKRAGRAAKSA